MKKDQVLDQRHRPLRDLRISVTDRCNFRCTYCMPKEIFGDDYQFLPKDHLLTFEEIARLTKIFVELGVKKIKLTGGEPLLRKDVYKLIAMLSKIEGIHDIGLTTNGVYLKKYGSKLYEAGLRRLNISLDAIDDDTFRRLNGRDVSAKTVLANIDYAVSIGFSVKVNMVVQKGVNDHQILPMTEYFKNKGIPLRFIEFMDVGNTNGWNMKDVLIKKDIVKMISSVYSIEPIDENYFGEVAKRYRHQDTGSEIGFITSVSEPFCSSCTRARISSDGKLYTCLYAHEGFDLRDFIRSGKSPEEIKMAIERVWQNRKDQYSVERTENKGMLNKNKIEMSYIGG
ncbi:MAG: GTP 3',8-cyclase MoaA [Bacillaceae bacterium]|uniref:GTP 3',8-cyclase MoaA n=1 Tax=Aeribacillus TaxID=1055323 RepID=UPI000E3967E5|nr:GTP 3',8-cyclase MoaA [Aeribacillus composti]MED0703633.1 GTP 3',8-cyclase MoaA [Aeribacillus composti]REJ15019.1 MAG: GTP 3',8-cyclase MoaA [Bacillaceae bacterium]REJ21176.1 MAG: GTP 3',8-cyclase MoaA [Bacillaceae bacterium]TVZ89122.1 cyclic pyranopterin phosphate synthase [Aeribacillus composti]